ncbi:MAG: CopG family transcriptional regulator [SAR324 cluster bacterium]|nr:CopG family transcriptional regulator [SAR324 cluster bacterium]
MEEKKQKLKQGRPPKYGQKMDCRVTIRLSEELGVKVDQLCEQRKISKSEFIQNLIKGEVNQVEKFSKTNLRGFGFSKRVAEEDIEEKLAEHVKNPTKISHLHPNRKILVSRQMSQRSAQMIANTAELIADSNRLFQINKNKDRNVA